MDTSESELGILDLIQVLKTTHPPTVPFIITFVTKVFVESLDRRFENVCELDLIFHVDKVHNILQEICMGGMVLETNMAEILTHVEGQDSKEKSEVTATSTIKVCQAFMTMRLF